MTSRFSLFLIGAAFLCAPTAMAQAIDCDAPSAAPPTEALRQACSQPYVYENLPHLDPSDPGFGYEGVTATFNTFIHATPSVATQVGAPYTPPSSGFLAGGDFRGDDLTTWYAILSTSNQAIAVNRTTGVVTPIGALAPSGGGDWTALTWDYATSQFYAIASDCTTFTTLYTINSTLTTATLVGSAGASMTCGVALGATAAGQLYGYSVVEDALVSINKATGAGTTIGLLGFDPNFAQGMDFDNEASGTCYIYAFNNTTFLGELRTCNVATGATTLVGPLGGPSGGLYDYSSASVVNMLVPVELTSFTGTADGTSAQLRWTTSSETNNAGFEVMIARDGVWTSLGFVDGHGTTTEAQAYAFRANGLAAGTHAFRLRQVDFDGATELTEEVEVTVGVPGTHALSQAYPNPFNPQASFDLSVASTQNVRVELFNAIGQRVATLFNGQMEGGATQQLRVDGSQLASGLYVARITGATFTDALTLSLLK